MKKIRMEKGITLIALIITIIVLLILAAVTIGSVKNNNIIGYTKNAATDYNKEKDKEESLLTGYEGLIEGTLANIGKATVGEKVQANSTINGQIYSSKNPIIPAGFTPINITGDNASTWNAESGPEVDKGLVIKDDDGNEFVWVPITTKVAAYTEGSNAEPETIYGNQLEDHTYDNDETNLNIAGCTDLNGDNVLNIDDFEIQLTNEFEAMAQSVNKYGGFYVGRYETSMVDAKVQSKGSTAENLITSLNAMPDSENGWDGTWYGLYALQKTYSTNSVQGSMMWGNQYKAMISWLGDEALKDQNTLDTIGNTTRYTGYVSTDIAKNIYDLYGNSFEWILEAYTYWPSMGRIRVWGFSENPAWPTLNDSWHPSYPDFYGLDAISSRLTLYVK